MKLRQLMIGMLLLCVAGCGCNDDTSPPGRNPAVITVVLNAGTGANPIQVDPGDTDPPVVPVDIFFVMDDGRDMAGILTPVDRLGVFLGIIPQNVGDMRERSFAAQRIYAQLQKKVEQKLKDRIAADFANDPTQFPQDFDPATFNPQLDFAFGVGRYEDFGGNFWQGPSANLLNQQARPFILNMPILRTALPEFMTLFEAALAREAPGDGNPVTTQFQRLSDPQSGIEALYQIAAGPNTAFPSGFDADNADADNDPHTGTLGSGQPCSLDAQLNPQTLPGTTGDVPAIRYSDPTPDPQDPFRSIYTVLDEDGNPVMNGQDPCRTSGNIGGVGWRDGAARFVILAGDIASVSPTEAAPPALVQSTDGNVPAPDAPRTAKAIPLVGFDGNAGRHGVANGPEGDGTPGNVGVAPVGAHTVQQTIDALNALDIEVIHLAAPDVISNDTKPTNGSDTSVNGDAQSDIDDVTDFFPTITPWTWMTAVSRLTGAISPTALSGQTGDNLALVYNLATVWPYNEADADGSEQSTQDNDIKDDVVDDLVDRLMEWVKGGYLKAVGGTTTPAKPELPKVFYDFEMIIEDPEVSDLVRTAPSDSVFLVEGAEVHVGFTGDDLPAMTQVVFPADGTINYAAIDETVPLPASETVRFVMRRRLNRIEGVTADNYEQFQEILQEIRERGDGVTVNSDGCIEHLVFTVAETSPGSGVYVVDSGSSDIVQAEGTLLLTVRTTEFPGPTAVLSSVERGCAVISDGGAGADPTPQAGGDCPFPAAAVDCSPPASKPTSGD